MVACNVILIMRATKYRRMIHFYRLFGSINIFSVKNETNHEISLLK